MFHASAVRHTRKNSRDSICRVESSLQNSFSLELPCTAPITIMENEKLPIESPPFLHGMMLDMRKIDKTTYVAREILYL